MGNTKHVKIFLMSNRNVVATMMKIFGAMMAAALTVTAAENRVAVRQKADTSTTLVSSINPAVFGSTIVFSATVRTPAVGSVVPTGTVTFQEGASVLSITDLDGNGAAQYRAPSLGAGSHDVTAIYSGNDNFQPSSAELREVITKCETSIALESSPNPADAEDQVAFAATVTSACPTTVKPTGMLVLKNGTGTLAIMSLAGGTATCSSKLSAAVHSVIGVYDGDSNFKGATSDPITQVVTSKAAAPTFVSFPADATYACSDLVRTPNDRLVKAVDQNGAPASITHAADVVTGGSCANRFTIERNYIATDSRGNTNSRTQHITVADTEGPVLAGIPADVTVTAETIPTVAKPTAVDMCEGEPQIFYHESHASIDKWRVLLLRSWTAIDGCGNATTARQKIIVNMASEPDEVAESDSSVARPGLGDSASAK